MVKPPFEAFFAQRDLHGIPLGEGLQRSIHIIVLCLDIVHGVSAMTFDVHDVPPFAIGSNEYPDVIGLTSAFGEQDSVMENDFYESIFGGGSLIFLCAFFGR